MSDLKLFTHDYRPTMWHKLNQTQPIVAIFFRNLACTMCQGMLRVLEGYQEQFRQFQAQPVVLAKTNPASLAGFIQHFRPQYPMLSDPSGDVFRAYSNASEQLEFQGGILVLPPRSITAVFRFVPQGLEQQLPINELLECIKTLNYYRSSITA